MKRRRARAPRRRPTLRQSLLETIEQKLVRLAFNPAAHPEEVVSSAVKLLTMLRKYGAKLVVLLQPSGKGQARISERQPADHGQIILSFGKYKRKTHRQVDPEYLVGITENCPSSDRRLRRAIRKSLALEDDMEGGS